MSQPPSDDLRVPAKELEDTEAAAPERVHLLAELCLEPECRHVGRGPCARSSSLPEPAPN
jgi:hypothetical protein